MSFGVYSPLGNQIYALKGATPTKKKKNITNIKNKMQFKSLFAFAALTLIPAVSALGCEVLISKKSGGDGPVKSSCIPKSGSKVIVINGKTVTVSADGSCKFSSKDLDPSLAMKFEGDCIGI